MSSKTFKYFPPVEEFSENSARFVELSITTTDGLRPNGGSIVNGYRALTIQNPGNVDFANSHIIGITSNSIINDSTKQTFPLRAISFFDNYITVGDNGESFSIDQQTELKVDFATQSYISYTTNRLNFLRHNSDFASGYELSYATAYWRGSSRKFKSTTLLESQINSQKLNYTLNYLGWETDRVITQNDKSIHYMGITNYALGDVSEFFTEFTPSSNISFDEIAFCLRCSNTVGGSMNMRIYNATAATVKANSNYAALAQVTVNLSDFIEHITDSTYGSSAIFGKFANAVTLTGGQRYTFAVSFTNVQGRGMAVAFAPKSGSTAIGYTNSNRDFAYDGYSFPFLLSTEDPGIVYTAPTNISLSSQSISESATIGSTVGTLSATDAEGGAMAFSLVSGVGSEDNASFVIVGDELRTAVSLNHEAKSSYLIRVQATDSSSLSYEKPFTISVTNVNEAPTNISLSATSITEGNEINAVIGILSAIEADVGDSVSFSVVSGDDKFNISGNELRASVIFDRDTETSHSVVVRAADAGGLSLDQSFTISVLNAGPTSISLSSTSIIESASSPAVVGMLSAVEPGGGSCSFALVSGAGSDDNATFALSGNELMLASGVSLDYETKNSYSIRVQALDSDGATVEQSFTISVLNENEMPSSISLSATYIQEGNAVGAVIGLLSAGDPDVSDSVSFAVVSGSDKVEVVGNELKALISFDFETSSSHSVVIRGTDMGGLFRDQSFTITVTNNSSDDPISLPTSDLPTLASGQVVASVTVNPMEIAVTLNGQPLPAGSVVRNTVSGQKFVKVSGGTLDFIAIEVEPRSSWGWGASGDAAWEIMQAL